MRLVTFTSASGPGGPRLGALLGDGHEVLDLTAAVLERGDAAPADYLDWLDLDGALLQRAQAIAAAGEAYGPFIRRRAETKLLAPVPRPRKVICIGLNYRDHARETKAEIPKDPVVFSKFSTAIVGPDEPIVLPVGSQKVDYEAELAVVIGRRAKRVHPDRAYEVVLGYANFHDVSARDFQFGDGGKQWQRGKSCDTFGPLGPFIATTDLIKNPHDLRIRFRLNGETLQDSRTSELIFNVPRLISFISETVTLEPGDLIATGTPAGVGFTRQPSVYLKPKDVCEVEVEGLGVLRNPVVGPPAD
jgi:2-keto-4-pentenoate hydratase/2-oxohepta-3-ene-1,7-dioic acid hydratase in catechol pathway